MKNKDMKVKLQIREKLCLSCGYPLSECWNRGCGMEVTRNGKLENRRSKAA